MMPNSCRRRLFAIVFESDTSAGRAFDVSLLVAVLISTIEVLADSVHSLHAKYATAFTACELIFTAAFSLEYVLRLLAVDNPVNYACSAFGMLDLCAILPSFLELALLLALLFSYLGDSLSPPQPFPVEFGRIRHGKQKTGEYAKTIEWESL